jgi:hypothetical protein
MGMHAPVTSVTHRYERYRIFLRIGILQLDRSMMIRTIVSLLLILTPCHVGGFAPQIALKAQRSALLAQERDNESVSELQLGNQVLTAIATLGVGLTIMTSPAFADGATKEFKFPPVDLSDKSRCVLKGGSAMGQANAARDKLYDLRQCKLSGANAAGYDLSGVSK